MWVFNCIIVKIQQLKAMQLLFSILHCIKRMHEHTYNVHTYIHTLINSYTWHPHTHTSQKTNKHTSAWCRSTCTDTPKKTKKHTHAHIRSGKTRAADCKRALIQPCELIPTCEMLSNNLIPLGAALKEKLFPFVIKCIWKVDNLLGFTLEACIRAANVNVRSVIQSEQHASYEIPPYMMRIMAQNACIKENSTLVL